jgi:hypothetical protein
MIIELRTPMIDREEHGEPQCRAGHDDVRGPVTAVTATGAQLAVSVTLHTSISSRCVSGVAMR